MRSIVVVVVVVLWLMKKEDMMEGHHYYVFPTSWGYYSFLIEMKNLILQILFPVGNIRGVEWIRCRHPQRLNCNGAANHCNIHFSENLSAMHEIFPIFKPLVEQRMERQQMIESIPNMKRKDLQALTKSCQIKANGKACVPFIHTLSLYVFFNS